MSPPELLVAGKALLWFALPLAFALRELWLLRDRRPSADQRCSERRWLR
jgi:hypothetical protein